MKLIKRAISEKDGAGTVTLIAEEPEDMWHVYNLISVGDTVRTTTVRKVVKESATGSTMSNKVRLNLTIEVEKVEFDPDKVALRLAGRNVAESQHVRLGAYHTLDLEAQRNFALGKPCWDAVHLDRLRTATDPTRTAELAAVVCQAGLAHLCLVTAHLTLVRAKIEVAVPRKRPGNDQHGKALKRFYEAIYQAVLRHVDFSLVKVVLLASPGFVKDDLFAYLSAEAVRRDDKVLTENRSKFVLVHASSGHKHALEEVLGSPGVAARLADTKAAAEVAALGAFYAALRDQPDRAYYGYQHVLKANEQQAIDTLMVTDELFRNSDVRMRRQYVDLVEACQAKGGKVHVFSAMHVSGQQLQQLSGIAAVLRFPLPDLDLDDESDDDEEGESTEGKRAHRGECKAEEGTGPFEVRNQLGEDMADMGL